MKILFKQKNESNDTSVLSSLGISQFHLKSLSFKDRKNTLRTSHHHTGFEVHIVSSGQYVYTVEDMSVCVPQGELLLISPYVKHFSSGETENAKKDTLTFCLLEDSRLLRAEIPPHVRMKTPPELTECIEAIGREGREARYLGETLIENRALECVIQLMRCFISEPPERTDPEDEADARVLLAKQYVKDNAGRAVTVREVADYCCISPKQLARLFSASQSPPVAEYIRQQRCKQIENLLAETDLPLKEISARLSFNNEYYFNSFFKKHSGMTPGAYRKSVKKS